MSTATLEVGKLVHTFSERYLQLSSTCSIRLAYSPDFLSSTASPITDLVPAGGLWIARGNGLQLSLNIELDGINMDDSRAREFIEDLGTLLKNAEMWSQLFLQTSLSVPARRVNDLNKPPTLLLSLRHGPQLCWNSKYATKAPILIVSDTRPPVDIPSAGLEEIRINLVFSRTSQNRSKRTRRRVPDQTGETSEDQVMLFEDDDLESAEPPHDSQPMPSFLFGNPMDDLHQRTSSSQASLSSNDEKLDGQFDISFSTENDPCFSDLAYQSQQFCSSQPTTPMCTQESESSSSHFSETDTAKMLDDGYSDPVPNNLPRPNSEILTSESDNMFLHPQSATVPKPPENPRKRSNSLPSPALPVLDVTAAAKLLDAALRTLICDIKPRLSRGIKASDISPGPKLAEISPALFSPGYLHAVCQRSRFLPRISHSISSVHRRARSAVSGSKIERLLSSQPNLELDSVPSTTTSQQALTTALQTHLWTLIQICLFDPRAARKLKPLQILPTGEDRISDEILDQEQLDLPPEPLQSPLLSDCAMLDDDLDEVEEDELLFSEDELLFSEDEDELLFSDDEIKGVALDNIGNGEEELLDNPDMGYLRCMDVDDDELTDGDVMLII